jgi:hypothetical protein
MTRSRKSVKNLMKFMSMELKTIKMMKYKQLIASFWLRTNNKKNSSSKILNIKNIEPSLSCEERTLYLPSVKSLISFSNAIKEKPNRKSVTISNNFLSMR